MAKGRMRRSSPRSKSRALPAAHTQCKGFDLDRAVVLGSVQHGEPGMLEIRPAFEIKVVTLPADKVRYIRTPLLESATLQVVEFRQTEAIIARGIRPQ